MVGEGTVIPSPLVRYTSHIPSITSILLPLSIHVTVGREERAYSVACPDARAMECLACWVRPASTVHVLGGVPATPGGR